MRARDSGHGSLRTDSGRPETLAKVRRLRPLSVVTPGATGALSFDEINAESGDSGAATPETPARPKNPPRLQTQSGVTPGAAGCASSEKILTPETPVWRHRRLRPIA